MSREGVKDMGSHSHGSQAKDVSARYGKWHAPLQGNSELSAAIHREGRKGLDKFGYESLAAGGGRKQFMEKRPGGFQCDHTVVCTA
mmetsp:Transcript_6606/g.15915  ORF Transcript_6606/g.15915 Transcript_6606/m.15915 type:complete len:86 (+) Transcript_6606:857-1114(+)